MNYVGRPPSSLQQVTQLPQQTIINAGAGAYVPPAGAKFLRVKLVGAGGGGTMGGNTVGTAGGNGTATTFGALTASGGEGGVAQQRGGFGGAAAGGNVANVPGQDGGGAGGLNATGAIFPGGAGGNSVMGHGGGGAPNSAVGRPGSGPGGGGAGGGGFAGNVSGSGGAGGGYVEHVYSAPLAASYAYAVGVGGAAGTGSTVAAGAGFNGQIVVEAHFSDLSFFAQQASSSGRLVQSQQHVRGDSQVFNASIPYDDTIPQISEGVQLFTVTITPQFVGSRLRISARAWVSPAAVVGIIGSIHKVGQNDALATGTLLATAADSEAPPMSLDVDVITADLASATYTVRMGGATSAGNIQLNGRSSGRRLGGAYNSFLRVDEFSP